MSQHYCPLCKTQLVEKFTLRGILFAILCFPCGILCCMRRRKLRCQNCDHEVYVVNGSVPKVVKAYKHYSNFKWQFRRNQDIPEPQMSEALPQEVAAASTASSTSPPNYTTTPTPMNNASPLSPINISPPNASS